MKGFTTWLQGKKTVLAGVLVLALTVVGFWYGKLTPAQALQLVSVAGFGIGLGDKLQRYLPQILIGLQGLASAIADLRASRPAAAVQALESSAEAILPGIAALTPIENTGLHVTGDPQHVTTVLAAATRQLTPTPGGGVH